MVVVAPPAHRIPRSTSSHSRRVEDRIAQRASSARPSARSPQAIARTSPAVSRQVRLRQPPPVAGAPKASRSGVSATGWRNRSGIDRNLRSAMDHLRGILAQVVALREMATHLVTLVRTGAPPLTFEVIDG